MKVLLFATLAVAACGQRLQRQLIAFGDGSRKWMTPEEVNGLIKPGLMKDWMDVTVEAHRNVTVKGKRTVSAIPDQPIHQAFVESVIEQFDSGNGLAGMQDTVTRMSAIEPGRHYTLPSGRQAAEYLLQQYKTAAGNREGIDVSMMLFEHSWEQPSVVVKVHGTDLSTEHVILGGHIDSIAGLPNSRAPGADDDASGSAAVLQVFREMMKAGFKPTRTVEFHGYAAEEGGLRGSQAISVDYADDGIDVVGMMQLDMIGYVHSSGPRISIIQDRTSSALNTFIEKLGAEYIPSVEMSKSNCGYGCSDHASWTSRGYDASFPFETNFGQHNPNIHTARDTIDGITWDHAVSFAKLGIAFVSEMGCDPTSEACT